MDVPKVAEKYFEDKKKSIIDATMRVCKSKPVYAVTLRDVAREAKISTGGIYNYFSSIDEIFARIVNAAHDGSFSREITDIFSSDFPPERIVIESFAAIGRMMDSLYKHFGSMFNELAHIYTADAERRKNMEGLTKINEELSVFYKNLDSLIDTGISNGRFKTNIPKSHILFMVANAIESLDDGIGFIIDNAERFDVEMKQGMAAEGMMTALANIVIDLLHINKG